MDITLLILSLVDAAFIGVITIASAVLFKFKAEYFGDYKKGFRLDCLSQYHYWLVLGGRVVLGCIIVTLNTMSYVGLICMVVPLIGIVYVLVKRPYSYNNIRSVANEFIMLIVLGVYGYYRAFVDPAAQDALSVTILPIVVIALLVICIVLNSVFMIRYWCDKKKEAVVDQEG